MFFFRTRVYAHTLKGDPGMCFSANWTLTSYSPYSVGVYSTEHEPSRLSLHVIFASDGPSTAKPKLPVPAPEITGRRAELRTIEGTKKITNIENVLRLCATEPFHGIPEYEWTKTRIYRLFFFFLPLTNNFPNYFSTCGYSRDLWTYFSEKLNGSAKFSIIRFFVSSNSNSQPGTIDFGRLS